MKILVKIKYRILVMLENYLWDRVEDFEFYLKIYYDLFEFGKYVIIEKSLKANTSSWQQSIHLLFSKKKNVLFSVKPICNNFNFKYKFLYKGSPEISVTKIVEKHDTLPCGDRNVFFTGRKSVKLEKYSYTYSWKLFNYSVLNFLLLYFFYHLSFIIYYYCILSF